MVGRFERIQSEEQGASTLEIGEYTTPTGQKIIVSRQALEIYGETFINQLALSTGKNRLVLADNIILQDAQNRFSDDYSLSPLVDLYAEYLVDSSDFEEMTKINPRTGQLYSENEWSDIAVRYDLEWDVTIQTAIKNNYPAVIARPDSDAGFIIIPSPDSLMDDSFKNRIVEGLSRLESSMLQIPGSSLDWAKISLQHEAGHLSDKNFNLSLEDIADAFLKGISRQQLIDSVTAEGEETLSAEITADISAARDFNRAANTDSSVLQTFANLRTMDSFYNHVDILGMMNREDGFKGHNTGAALQEYLETGQTASIQQDSIQQSTAYTNTLVRGFIGAAEGQESISSRGGIRSISIYPDNPINGATDSVITQNDYNDARNGNDPMRIASLGAHLVNENPERVYASVSVLLENGAFDHAPDSKINAERFLRATQQNAPGLINENLIGQYRQAFQASENQAYLEHLHRYNIQPTVPSEQTPLPSITQSSPDMAFAP